MSSSTSGSADHTASTPDTPDTPDADDGDTRQAGAFDIRTIIALLIGIYGVVLLIAGLIGPTTAELKKTGGLNINLTAGIGMVVVAAAFIIWARLRPVIVPAQPVDDEAGAGNH